MKKLAILSLLLVNSLYFNACRKEPVEPAIEIGNNNTNNNNNNNGTPLNPNDIKITSPGTFYAKIDGKLHVHVEGKENIMTGTGTSKAHASEPDTSKAKYQAHYLKDGTPDISLFTISKGSMKFIGYQPEDDAFNAFFSPGTYSYPANGIEYFDGIEIRQYESNTVWTTLDGDQTGSTFTIVEIKEETQLGMTRLKVLSKFSCKLYDLDGNMRQLTDGVAVSYFANR